MTLPKIFFLKISLQGNGVQLYNIQDTKCVCKYEGSWKF